MPKKLLTSFLILFFLAPQFSSAQTAETPAPQENIIPVYLFLHHTNTEPEAPLGILAITPFTDESFVWIYPPIDPTADVEKTEALASDTVSHLHATTTVYYDDIKLVGAPGTNTATLYAYDYQGNRTKLTENGTATYFPNTLYNTAGATTTKHIFANGTLIATVEKGPTATITRYVHTDNLSGSNVITDSAGNIAETIDYYPYGQARLDSKAGDYNGEKRKFAGTEYDPSSGLHYMQARYYDSVQGRFLSEDPSFLATGNEQQIEKLTGGSFANYLANPQNLNSYSYAINNPLKYKDSEGNYYQLAIGAGLGFISGVTSEYVGDVVNNVNERGFAPSVFVPQGGFGETVKRYGTKGMEGLAVGVAVAFNPFVGSGAQGTLTLLESKSQTGQYNIPKAIVDTGITLGTAGIGKTATQVSGRLPNVGTQAFYTGAHTQQQALLESIQVSLNAISVALTNIIHSLQIGITSNQKKN